MDEDQVILVDGSVQDFAGGVDCVEHGGVVDRAELLHGLVEPTDLDDHASG